MLAALAPTAESSCRLFALNLIAGRARYLGALLLALVVTATPAAAQGPAFVQLPSGGFVPCDHPLAIAAGLGCGQATPTAPTPAPVPVPTAGPGCDPRPNPYLEPERAAACAAWDLANRPRPALPAFEVGAVYADGYNQSRIVVLSVTPSLEGVPVVTAEYLTGAVGQVFAFRVNAGAPWQRVTP